MDYFASFPPIPVNWPCEWHIERAWIQPNKGTSLIVLSVYLLVNGVYHVAPCCFVL